MVHYGTAAVLNVVEAVVAGVNDLGGAARPAAARRRFSFWARPVGLGAGSPLCLAAGSTGNALYRTTPVHLTRKTKTAISGQLSI